MDEAADLKEHVEHYVTQELVPAGHSLVVTSRPEGVRLRLFERFVIVNLDPLSEEQQNSAINMQATAARSSAIERNRAQSSALERAQSQPIAAKGTHQGAAQCMQLIALPLVAASRHLQPARASSRGPHRSARPRSISLDLARTPSTSRDLASPRTFPSQLEGSAFYSHLRAFSTLRHAHDALYANEAFPLEPDRTFLSRFETADRFQLAAGVGCELRAIRNQGPNQQPDSRSPTRASALSWRPIVASAATALATDERVPRGRA